MSNRDFVRELYHTAGANDRRAAARANHPVVSREVEQCREKDGLQANRTPAGVVLNWSSEANNLIYFAVNILRIGKIAEHIDAGEPLLFIHARDDKRPPKNN